VRVVRDGASNIVLGDQVGIAGTDTGQIGVADPPALKDAFEAAFPDGEKAALDSLESATSKPFGVFRPDSHGSGMLVFVPSGFGDGCGPVFGLLSHGQRIGIEHEFIAADSRSGA
jgi:hypothetical protein